MYEQNSGSGEHHTCHVLGPLGKEVLLRADREDVARHLRGIVQRACQHHVRPIGLEQLEDLAKQSDVQSLACTVYLFSEVQGSGPSQPKACK